MSELRSRDRFTPPGLEPTWTAVSGDHNERQTKPECDTRSILLSSSIFVVRSSRGSSCRKVGSSTLKLFIRVTVGVGADDKGADQVKYFGLS